jgi:hypothetical protein
MRKYAVLSSNQKLWIKPSMTKNVAAGDCSSFYQPEGHQSQEQIVPPPFSIVVYHACLLYYLQS